MKPACMLCAAMIRRPYTKIHYPGSIPVLLRLQLARIAPLVDQQKNENVIQRPKPHETGGIDRKENIYSEVPENFMPISLHQY